METKTIGVGRVDETMNPHDRLLLEKKRSPTEGFEPSTTGLKVQRSELSGSLYLINKGNKNPNPKDLSGKIMVVLIE